ncbi:MAG: hypothetical protein GX879_01720 [Bacteroidales bacterium]|nr:hypothetical protein [Bacteroidales bacterium]
MMFNDIPAGTEAIKEAIYVGDKGVLPENEGKLVIITGEIKLIEQGYDPELDIYLNSIRAYRTSYELKEDLVEKIETWKQIDKEEILGKAKCGDFILSEKIIQSFLIDATYSNFDTEELSKSDLYYSEDKSLTDGHFIYLDHDEEILNRYKYTYFDFEKNPLATIVGIQKDNTIEYDENVKSNTITLGIYQHSELIEYSDNMNIAILIFTVVLIVLFIAIGIFQFLRGIRYKAEIKEEKESGIIKNKYTLSYENKIFRIIGIFTFLVVGLLLIGLTPGFFLDKEAKVKTVKDAIYLQNNNYQAENEGKVIILTGKLNIEEAIFDDEHGITINAPVVCKQIYKYNKNSDDKDKWEKHESSKRYTAEASIGDYKITEKLLNTINCNTSYSTFNAFELIAANYELIEDKKWKHKIAISPQDDKNIRIHYSSIDFDKNTEFTIIGKQVNSTIDVYPGINDMAVINKKLSHKEAIKYAEKDDMVGLWTFLIIALFFTIFGFAAYFKPKINKNSIFGWEDDTVDNL